MYRVMAVCYCRHVASIKTPFHDAGIYFYLRRIAAQNDTIFCQIHEKNRHVRLLG